jgi:hypothetical protein
MDKLIDLILYRPLKESNKPSQLNKEINYNMKQVSMLKFFFIFIYKIYIII